MYYSTYTLEDDLTPYIRIDAEYMEVDRFDKTCTPGKTIPCGNQCRQPQNCKTKNRVSASNQALRESYAQRVRESKAGTYRKRKAQKKLAAAAQGSQGNEVFYAKAASGKGAKYGTTTQTPISVLVRQARNKDLGRNPNYVAPRKKKASK